MADEVDVLLARVDDAALRADLREQFDRLRNKRQFGLVFEDHLPERVVLRDRAIRRGTKVVPRDDESAEPLLVESIRSGVAMVTSRDGERTEIPVDDLVAVAEFGEAIYPGLKRLGSVDRGGDKPAHTVIEGENYHALEALQFTHAGKIDCIYIDPPYNTGARDWKYNNDYVDGDDAYRHSKWLAMMQRRLLLAKKLLNSDDSVLVVTIDEKEYLRLGMLLEQVFPSGTIEMVTSVISAKGVARFGQFSRVEEYVYTVRLGDQEVRLGESNMLDDSRSASAKVGKPVDWLGLRRREPTARRGARPKQFYPVFVSTETGHLVSVGDFITNEVDRTTVATPSGTFAVWPLLPDGTEGLWGITPETARAYLEQGYLRARNAKLSRQYAAVQYLTSGTVAGIGNGDIAVEGRDEDGSVVATHATAKGVIPKRVWNVPAHNAERGGTKVLSALLPDRRFPFPKSLYAVEDAIRFFVADKPDATVLDFFSGSGTTAHAVARLNKQDGGRRVSISVTNNEVSDAEAKKLRADGHRPGDPEWEALGIFEHITRPRITAAITGKTPDGDPIKGDYKFTDEFPMADGFEENVEFMELTYLDADDIELDLAFQAIAPLLWMRAGCRGATITTSLDADGEPLPYATADAYGVLFDPDQWRPFLDELPDDATTAFIVTDSASAFAGVATELPDQLHAVRLYQNYLATFAINQLTERDDT